MTLPWVHSASQCSGDGSSRWIRTQGRNARWLLGAAVLSRNRAFAPVGVAKLGVQIFALRHCAPKRWLKLRMHFYFINHKQASK